MNRGCSQRFVDMEVVYLRSSPLQMAALATGEVQFAASGGSPLLFAVSGGQDLKIIAGQGIKHDEIAQSFESPRATST